MRWLLFLLLLASQLYAVDGLVINEIMYNSTNSWGGSTNEWFEIYNNDSISYNLSGWSVAEPADRLIKGTDLMLNRSEYIIIARSISKFLTAYNVSCKIANASIALSNSGEWIALKNSSGTVVANVTYTNEFADGNDKTLSLARNYWRESLQGGGTPCTQNFEEHDVGVWLEKTCRNELVAHLDNTGLNDEDIILELYLHEAYDSDEMQLASFGTDDAIFTLGKLNEGNYIATINITFSNITKYAELNFTIVLPNENISLNANVSIEDKQYIISTYPEDACLDAEIYVAPIGLNNSFIVGTLAPFDEIWSWYDFYSMVDDFVDFGSYELCENILEVYNYNDTNLENNFACENFTIVPEAGQTRMRIKTFVANENYDLNETLFWSAQIFPIQNGTVGNFTVTLQKKKSEPMVLFGQENLNLTGDLISYGNYTIPEDKIEGVYKLRAKFTYSDRYFDSGDSGQFWLAGLKDLGLANFTVLQMPASLSFGGFGSVFVKFFSGNFNYNKLKFLVYGYPSQVLADTQGNGLSASDFDSDVSIELENVKRGQEIYVALPAFAKQNCDSNYGSGPYRTRVRAYDENGKPITTTDINLQVSGQSAFCPARETRSAGGRVGGTTLQQKQQQANLQPESLEFPNAVQQGDSFILKAKITNSLNSTKLIDAYSYVFDGQKLFTEGGWTANKKTITLNEKEAHEIELENKIKDDAEPGTHTIRFRVKDGSKNIDSDGAITITEKTKSETASAGSGLPAATGAAVYVSKTNSLNPAISLFILLLLVLVLVLIKSR